MIVRILDSALRVVKSSDEWSGRLSTGLAQEMQKGLRHFMDQVEILYRESTLRTPRKKTGKLDEPGSEVLAKTNPTSAAQILAERC